MCCKPVVTAPASEIATGDPSGGAKTGGAELVEAGLGGVERFLRLVDPILFEQRATEHELRAPADLTVRELLYAAGETVDQGVALWRAEASAGATASVAVPDAAAAAMVRGPIPITGS